MRGIIVQELNDDEALQYGGLCSDNDGWTLLPMMLIQALDEVAAKEIALESATRAIIAAGCRIRGEAEVVYVSPAEPVVVAA